MSLRVGFCPSCGAPLEGLWQHIVVVCRFCRAEVIPGGEADGVVPRIPDDGRPRISLGGRTYLVLGLLATGESSHVYLARWVVRLGETVLIKVATSPAGREQLRKEQRALSQLWKSDAQGAEYYVQRIPPPVAHGPVHILKDEYWASVMQYRAGFHTSLTQAVADNDGALSGRILVWVAKRTLETLAFIHRSGFVHGAITPDHIVLHPKEHGCLLIGFSEAQNHMSSIKRPLPVHISTRWRDVYPGVLTRTQQATQHTDVAMVAKCILHSAGTRWLNRGGSLPRALSAVIQRAADGDFTDAWELRERIDAAAKADYGAPKYSPLVPAEADDD